jgi:hypothetical protein
MQKIPKSPNITQNSVTNRSYMFKTILKTMFCTLVYLTCSTISSETTAEDKEGFNNFLNRKTTSHHKMKNIISSKLDTLANFNDDVIKKRIH